MSSTNKDAEMPLRLAGSHTAELGRPALLARPPRIASVCVLGSKAARAASNAPRLELANSIADAIARRAWQPIDAVLFPGGFVRSQSFIGCMSDRERLRRLENEAWFGGIANAAAKLNAVTSGALVVVGADSSAPTRGQVGDQLCVALCQRRIVGLARKIYPTDLDTRGCARPLVPAAADFTSRRRFVLLPNGSWACLNSCYDLFGVTDSPPRLAARSRGMRMLYQDGEYLRYGSTGFRRLRAELLDQWATLLRGWAPDVALAAIHGFERPGRDGYWQRHGIAAASAALGGSLVVGAAHFEDALPTRGQSPLASDNVPASHLALGPNRPASRLRPTDSFVMTACGLEASVRLFTRR